MEVQVKVSKNSQANLHDRNLKHKPKQLDTSQQYFCRFLAVRPYGWSNHTGFITKIDFSKNDYYFVINFRLKHCLVSLLIELLPD